MSTEGSPEAGHIEVHGDIRNLVVVGHAHGDVNAPGGASAQSEPQELPPDLSIFHNHEDALSSLSAAGFEGAQVHVLRGLPGTGKTSTAVHWASVHVDRFPAGRVWLDLRGAGRGGPLEAHDALGLLLASAHIAPQTIPSDTDARARLWRSYAFHRKMFVLLDNAASASQVLPLLPNGPETITVVTSRHALTELESLNGVQFIDIDLLEPQESVTMLRRFIGEGEQASEAELVRLAQLCGHLPLALAIIGTRLRKTPLLTTAELITELEERGGILEPVKAVCDAVYEKLTPDATRLLRLLGLAPGSQLSLDAVIALAGVSAAEAREQIRELAEVQLLVVDTPRRCVYIHDLLQSYAAQLAGAAQHHDEAQEALARLGLWYTARAHAAARALGAPLRPIPAASSSFESGRAAQHWYQSEAANLPIMVDALVAWKLPAAASALCQAVVELCAFNNATSWVRLAEKGLATAEALGDVGSQAHFHESLGKSHAQTGRPDLAIGLHERALTLRDQIGDLAGQARSLNAIGLAHWRLGQFDRAQQELSDALERSRSADDSTLEALALMNLGRTLLSRAETADAPDAERAFYSEALTYLNAALERLDVQSQGFYLANALYNRALALTGLGEDTDAVASADQAVTIARGLDVPLVLAPALRVQALTYVALGRHADAEQLLTEAIEILQTLGDDSRRDQFVRDLDRLRQ